MHPPRMPGCCRSQGRRGRRLHTIALNMCRDGGMSCGGSRQCIKKGAPYLALGPLCPMRTGQCRAAGGTGFADAAVAQMHHLYDLTGSAARVFPTVNCPTCRRWEQASQTLSPVGPENGYESRGMHPASSGLPLIPRLGVTLSAKK